MDYLWSPWRYRYVTEGAERGEGCVLCRAVADPDRDRERLVLHRARANFILLNLFPYTTAHCMIVPYMHVPRLVDLPAEALGEMMALAQRIECAIQASYRPEGYNLGMNLGSSAGAGVADHLHLHFLPRWGGDTNFLTVVGETRVLPEDLATTYDKLAGFFRDPSPCSQA